MKRILDYTGPVRIERSHEGDEIELGGRRYTLGDYIAKALGAPLEDMGCEGYELKGRLHILLELVEGGE